MQDIEKAAQSTYQQANTTPWPVVAESREEALHGAKLAGPADIQKY